MSITTLLSTCSLARTRDGGGAYAHHSPFDVLPHSNARQRGVYAHHHPPLDVLPRSNAMWRGAYAHHHFLSMWFLTRMQDGTRCCEFDTRRRNGPPPSESSIAVNFNARSRDRPSAPVAINFNPRRRTTPPPSTIPRSLERKWDFLIFMFQSDP
jgi:hypothetical protein